MDLSRNIILLRSVDITFEWVQPIIYLMSV